MSNEDKKQFISKQQDYVMRSNMINKHSGLFVEFFKARVELLIKQVLTKMWGVVDYFIRYEYQGTGIPRLTRFSIARICITRFFELVQKNLHNTIL